MILSLLPIDFGCHLKIQSSFNPAGLFVEIRSSLRDTLLHGLRDGLNAQIRLPEESLSEDGSSQRTSEEFWAAGIFGGQSRQIGLGCRYGCGIPDCSSSLSENSAPWFHMQGVCRRSGYPREIFLKSPPELPQSFLKGSKVMFPLFRYPANETVSYLGHRSRLIRKADLYPHVKLCLNDIHMLQACLRKNSVRARISPAMPCLGRTSATSFQPSLSASRMPAKCCWISSSLGSQYCGKSSGASP